MTPPTGAVIYTFDGSSFYRKVDDGWQPWFGSKVEYTRDSVLESTEDYLDIGATTYEDLTITAIVFSRANRNTLQSKIGTTAVLGNSLSYSQDATLVSAKPIASGNSAEFWIELVFVRRPTGS